MECYVVFSEWYIEGESGNLIIGVYTSEEEAINALKERVRTADMPDAESFSFQIYENSEHSFGAGEDGCYAHHIATKIEKCILH